MSSITSNLNKIYMNIIVPEKILMEGMIQDAKNYKVGELLQSKTLALETQLQLECNLQSVQKEIESLYKLNYKNINVKITDNKESKIRVENLSDYISFLNEVLRIDKITNEDRKKLSFYLPQIPKYINHVKIVNGESQKIASDIIGDVTGWDTISTLQDIACKYYPDKKCNFRCLEIESYQHGTSIELSIILDIF